jgi:hypothetical protein
MQRVHLESNLLKTAAYQDQLDFLELEFRSGVVPHYFGVSALTYQELLRAESKGGYFNRHIRNCFATVMIQPAATTPSHHTGAIAAAATK